MATFIHVVGDIGVGKSTVAYALAKMYEGFGKHCAGSEEIFTSRREAEAEHPGADIYFVEYQKESDLAARPGELVIRLERIAAANAEA